MSIKRFERKLTKRTKIVYTKLCIYYHKYIFREDRYEKKSMIFQTIQIYHYACIVCSDGKCKKKVYSLHLIVIIMI